MAWLLANWQGVFLAVLGVDAALLPLFPKSGILIAVKNFISGLGLK